MPRLISLRWTHRKVYWFCRAAAKRPRLVGGPSGLFRLLQGFTVGFAVESSSLYHLGVESWNTWARSLENVSYAICDNMHPRSLISAFVVRCQDRMYSLYSRNFKILAGFCSGAGQFVSCLVGECWRHILSWRVSHVSVLMKIRARSRPRGPE